MAYTTGIITVRSRLYDMTGITNYTPSNGVDLGKVGDLVMAKFHRDVQFYRGLASGSAPKYASIDGTGTLLEFSLHEYDAAVMKLVSQNIRPSGANNNFHGFDAGSNYELGHLLDSNELISLLVADESDPTDYPMLYIPSAVIVDVDSISLSRAERSIMTPATIRIVGLHNDTIGGPFVFGDPSSFPSLA
jgi:hypothetical protein